jgi:ribosomal protein S4
MIYPGYLLNPGDMFQVDPERVLFALGAPKDTEDRQASRAYRKRLQKARAAAEVSAEAEVEASEEAAPAAAEEPVDEAAAEKKLRKQHKDTLQSLLQDAKSVLTNKSTDAPSAKKKQNIRAFAAAVRRAIGNANRTATEDLDSTVAELVAKLSLADRKPASQPATPAAAVTDPSLQAQLTAQAHGTGPEALDPESKKTLAMALREIRENPIDASKAYATPWRPRPFLSAFAFIPRYLEVNHNICSAVYLRHPVARPGLAEVPTPFGAETGVLAYNWYLRRR